MTVFKNKINIAHFISPDEYTSQNSHNTLYYSFLTSDWGNYLIVFNSTFWIYWLSFGNDCQEELQKAKNFWAKNEFIESSSFDFSLINGLVLKGTPFQQKVWSELMTIPRGDTMTYSKIAERIALPHGSQAVGNAVGANHIAVLLPCHRAVSQKGAATNYRWGRDLKIKILLDEQENRLPKQGQQRLLF